MWVLLFFFLTCALAALAEEQRVLFIGNSFSFVSGGIWKQYKRIAEACIPGLAVTTNFQGEGAWTLHRAAQDASTQQLVHAGDYDLLVLQDQSELAESGYKDVETLFAREARNHGARIGLYQTWATPEADGDNMTRGTLLRKQYYQGLRDVARKSGAEVVVARAGEAFLEILRAHGFDYEYPAYRRLLSGDWDHPSPIGMNLVAWTMVQSFNAARLPKNGCDATRVQPVQGQTYEQRDHYARIACVLAGICEKEPEPTLPPDCKIAAQLQGEWVRRQRRPAAECKLRASGDCTYLEHWNVSGTQVTQSTGDVHKSRTLRVSEYGKRMCFVKLIPEFTYVKGFKGGKVMFNDCSVWTRKDRADESQVDECWCVDPQGWRDPEGDSCESYERGNHKSNVTQCEVQGNIPISMFKSLQAKDTCPGCNRCTSTPLHVKHMW